MRTLVLRALSVGILFLVLSPGTPVGAAPPQRSTAPPRTAPAPRTAAQPRDPRPVAIALEPILATEVEALLAEPNALLVTDYYYIDLGFGPNFRMDAVVVDAVGSKAIAKGLRVQVRDPESRSRQDGTSYLDLDELQALSRSLTSMVERAETWTGNDDRRATELTFTSAGGFRLAIRQTARQLRAYLSTGLLDPVVTSIDITDLGTLKVACDEAIAILTRK